MNRAGVVLVTGAAGFLGGHMVREFHERGWRVVGVDQLSREHVGNFAGHAYHQSNVSCDDLHRILKAEAPTACLHCAGSASVPFSMKLPLQDFRANALMTAEVLEALRMCAPACSFILLSSAAVYGSPDVLPISESTPAAPISAYGFHKHMAEQLCGEYAKLHGLRTACVRIFSAYGPGLQRQVLWDLCRKIMSGDALVLQGTGEESRDFVHARDIARAILTVVASAPLRGECYNIGSGVETPIASLAQMLVTALQESRSIAFDGVLPAGTPVRWQADVAKLKALGFVPEISIERGVHDYAAWARPFLTKR